jgi:hypothetical protein
LRRKAPQLSLGFYVLTEMAIAIFRISIILIAFTNLVKYRLISPPSAGKSTYVPRLLEKRYIRIHKNVTTLL